ncbi:hypothetical protein KY362_00420, partial [Candidatus Woesearchaeota archaeon]|nr:hypothetical protein [Candidatus Woesearchaeota archaeon]
LPDLSSEAMKERVRLTEDLDRLVQEAKVKGFDERTVSDAFRKLETLIAYGSDDDYKDAKRAAETFQKVLMRHTMRPQTDIYALLDIGDRKKADFGYVMEKVSEIQLLELSERLKRLMPHNKLVRRTFDREFGADIVGCATELGKEEARFGASDILDSDTACTSLLSYAEVNLDLTLHFTERLLCIARKDAPPELDGRYLAKHRYMAAVSRDLEKLESPTTCGIESVNSAFNLSPADMHDRHINDLVRHTLEQSGMRGPVYVMVTEYFYCGLAPKLCDPVADTEERLQIGQSNIVVDVFNAENAPRQLKLVSKEPTHEKKEKLLESMTMAYAIPDRKTAAEHLPRLSGFQLSEQSKCFFLTSRYDQQGRFLWRVQDSRSAKLSAYRPTYQNDNHAAAIGFAVTSPYIELVPRSELAKRLQKLARKEC